MSSEGKSTIPMPADTESKVPEWTFVARVASIPWISSSLNTIDDTLAKNAYLASPYSTAKGIGATAYKYTEPIQSAVAPLVASADSLANKTLDVVEKRYPYPFQAKPEELASFVRERRNSVQGFITHRRESVEEGVKGIDQKFAPLVDFYESAITRVGGTPSAHEQQQYQYQRAISLSRDIANNLSVYSAEQLKHLQASSVLIQRAQDTAHSVQNLASTSYSRIHILSDSMIVQLQKIQASTSALSLSLTGSANGHARHVQENLSALSKQFGETVSSLHSIVIQKDVSLHDKVNLVGKEVSERVSPLLETVRHTVEGVMRREKAEAK